MSMPKGERITFGHTAVEALRILVSTRLRSIPDATFEVVERLLAEFGGEPLPTGTSLDRPGRAVLEEGICAIGRHLPPRRSQGLDTRLAWLIDIVDGNALDLEILSYLARAKLYEPYANIFGLFLERGASPGEVNLEALAALTGHSIYAVRKRLSAGYPLFDVGLAVDCGGDDWGPGNFAHRVALMRSTSGRALSRDMLGRAPAASLDWASFTHLGELGALARNLVVEAIRRRKGVNILLHGLPGTGKSEFARALAQECGLHAVLVGEADESGGEPVRSERLAHLAVARSLVAHSREHLLIVDEADDLMLSDDGTRGSKFFLNNLIEKATSPTVWIVNEPERLGSPILRRMNLAIRFDLPGLAIRGEIAQRIAAEERLKVTAEDVAKIARLMIAPAVIRSGVRAAAWTRGGADVAVMAAGSIEEAIAGKRSISRTPSSHFDPKLSNANFDLVSLSTQLKESEVRNWSILAFGPPGTGKSALARHIASTLGLETIEKRASDLLSMWVGQTEKGIAAAFREAADRRALLIIDEADSLLRNRDRAHHSWEATMTNEMLTWMEAAQTPFFATTNLKTTLDPATARRFSISVEFFPLSKEQADALYQRYFRLPAPKELARLEDLTPGDFAQVAHRFSLLGDWSHSRALSWLTELTEGRAGTSPIGFR